jgi:hypothetical protein
MRARIANNVERASAQLKTNINITMFLKEYKKNKRSD